MNPTTAIQAVTAQLIQNPGAAVRYINARQNLPNYLFTSTFLPPIQKPSYTAKAATMRLLVTPAEPIGMNSPFPEVGGLQSTLWQGETDKYGAKITLQEEQIREVQQNLIHAVAFGTDPTQIVRNFYSQMLDGIRASMDMAEELAAGQAVMTGKYNLKKGVGVRVDYGVPADHKKSVTGAASYTTGNASTFWEDVVAAENVLGNDIKARLVSLTTFNAIVGNPANNAFVESGPETVVPGVQRYVISKRPPAGQLTGQDARYARKEFLVIGSKYQYLDLKTGTTSLVATAPDGYVSIVANNAAAPYVSPVEGVSIQAILGITHVGPTTENDGALGRYVKIVKDDDRPWGVRFDTAENFVPVIEEPRKLYILQTT